MSPQKCPKGHGNMEMTKTEKTMIFKGIDITFEARAYVCSECGLEAGTVETASSVQRAIADTYRRKKNFLISEEIRSLRQIRGLSQQDLADKMKVGVASIKRWETGLIQSASMDRLLRTILQCECPADVYSGNRNFSISRIKLISRQFEKGLGRRLLKKGDKMLFLAKYLWYADMLAFKLLGRSMTGAAYAALPYGPQLNNYSDLVDQIKRADENEAEILTTEEARIIEQIIRAFPTEQAVYDAAHREEVWREKPNGYSIPYSDSYRITEKWGV